jgi:HD-like signal output (HDOD) protein
MLLTRVSHAELIEAAKELPMAPRLLGELGVLINDPNSDAQDVTDLLKQDPAIAARLIRIANSAVYARSVPVSSTEGAVSCIGFDEVHRLVGALASHQLAERRYDLHGISASRLRNISLFTAVLMEDLAVPARESRRACYTIGLLRSVGIMALELIGCRHSQVPPFNPGTGQPLDEWEKCHWGLDNCEAAEVILKEWRMPHETVLAVRHHYRPAQLHNPMIHLLALAAGSASDRYQGIDGEEGYWQPTAETFRRAGLDLRDFQMASERAQETFERLETALV